ncbi:hypothetical protein [Shewanella psychrotolerans]|uniref:hypothetical protein n=1 Tax=Shewanella psychrotolerans TaxID=2864206 RepID=UPI001C657F7D|nr:hypothetical protein [Shewanella psychrotolerans]QYK00886.1 hypothetical protein K0I62_16070 [Shewanella psychrotolerans]
MFQAMALVLTIIGTTLIYLTRKHQRVLRQRLPAPVALMGISILLAALLSWLQLLTTTAAVFTWIFTAISLFACIPFLTLINKQEHSK